MITVELSQERYDELLRKEALLEIIERFYAKTTDYSFRDVVGYLFAELKDEKA
jgi:hypothetical protein